VPPDVSHRARNEGKVFSRIGNRDVTEMREAFDQLEEKTTVTWYGACEGFLRGKGVA